MSFVMKAFSAFWHMSHIARVCSAGSLWVQAAATPECQSPLDGKGGLFLPVARTAFPDLCELLTSDLKLQRFSFQQSCQFS